MADQILFLIDGSDFVLRLRANQPIVSEIEAALKPGEQSRILSATEESEAALARILGASK
jgi:hypothetical protein